MRTKTRARNNVNSGRLLSSRPASNGIPDLRLRPYRRWWVQALLIAWRWRTEALAMAVVVGVWIWINDPLGEIGAAVGIAVLIVAVFAVPHTRRHAWPRVMCVVTRHRIRTGMAQLATANRDGRLPWIVWIRPTPVGERAWIWMIPGLSVKDIEDRTEALAACCWARETRIERSRKRAMLVRIDVVRRDPLSAPKPIDSPLIDDTRHVQAVEPLKVIELLNTRTDTRTVTTPTTPVRKVTSEGTRSLPASPTPSTNTATDTSGPTTPSDSKNADRADPDRPRIVTRHGEDISDYV